MPPRKGKNPLEIVCDSREQAPYLFSQYECAVRVGTIKYGDYTVVGLENCVAVERKSLNDFVGSICQGRERFEREILAASQQREFFAVVIEGTPLDVASHLYVSKMTPHSVLQTAISWALKYDVHFIWAGSRNSAEYHTFHILDKFQKLHYLKNTDSGVPNTGQ